MTDKMRERAQLAETMGAWRRVLQNCLVEELGFSAKDDEDDGYGYETILNTLMHQIEPLFLDSLEREQGPPISQREAYLRGYAAGEREQGTAPFKHFPERHVNAVGNFVLCQCGWKSTVRKPDWRKPDQEDEFGELAAEEWRKHVGEQGTASEARIRLKARIAALEHSAKVGTSVRTKLIQEAKAELAQLATTEREGEI